MNEKILAISVVVSALVASLGIVVPYLVRATPNIITDDASYYIATTDNFTVKIDKGNGMIRSVKLAGSDIELAFPAGQTYSFWYPEYNNHPTDADTTVTVISNTPTSASVKAVWTLAYVITTWYFNFTKTCDYFDAYLQRDITTDKIFMNSQLCHMLSATFDRAGVTAYNGSLDEFWQSGFGGNGNWNYTRYMTHCMPSAYNNDFYPFQYCVDDTNHITVAFICSNVSDNQYYTFAEDIIHKFEGEYPGCPGTWEMQWDYLSNEGLGYAEAGLCLWQQLQIAIIWGNEYDAKAISQQIHADNPPAPQLGDHYFMAWDAASVSVGSRILNWIYIHTDSILCMYQKTKLAATTTPAISFINTGMPDNPITYNITKSGQSFVKLASSDYYNTSGHLTGTGWKGAYAVSTIGEVTNNLTMKVYENNQSRLLIGNSNNDIADLEITFWLGFFDPSKYSAESIGTNKYRVTFDDSVRGNIYTCIEGTGNISSSEYDATNKVITFIPSQSDCKLEIYLLEDSSENPQIISINDNTSSPVTITDTTPLFNVSFSGLANAKYIHMEIAYDSDYTDVYRNFSDGNIHYINQSNDVAYWGDSCYEETDATHFEFTIPDSEALAVGAYFIRVNIYHLEE